MGDVITSKINPTEFGQKPLVRSSNIVCRFWLAGRCNRHPCRFLHQNLPRPSNNVSWRTSEQSNAMALEKRPMRKPNYDHDNSFAPSNGTQNGCTQKTFIQHPRIGTAVVPSTSVKAPQGKIIEQPGTAQRIFVADAPLEQVYPTWLPSTSVRAPQDKLIEKLESAQRICSHVGAGAPLRQMDTTLVPSTSTTAPQDEKVERPKRGRWVSNDVNADAPLKHQKIDATSVPNTSVKSLKDRAIERRRRRNQKMANLRMANQVVANASLELHKTDATLVASTSMKGSEDKTSEKLKIAQSISNHVIADAPLMQIDATLLPSTSVKAPQDKRIEKPKTTQSISNHVIADAPLKRVDTTLLPCTSVKATEDKRIEKPKTAQSISSHIIADAPLKQVNTTLLPGTSVKAPQDKTIEKPRRAQRIFNCVVANAPSKQVDTTFLGSSSVKAPQDAPLENHKVNSTLFPSTSVKATQVENSYLVSAMKVDVSKDIFALGDEPWRDLNSSMEKSSSVGIKDPNPQRDSNSSTENSSYVGSNDPTPQCKIIKKFRIRRIYNDVIRPATLKHPETGSVLVPATTPTASNGKSGSLVLATKSDVPEDKKSSLVLTTAEDNAIKVGIKRPCLDWMFNTCAKGCACQCLHNWYFGDCFSLLRMLGKHNQAVCGIALPSMSDKLFSAYNDGIVDVFDCHTGDTARTMILGDEIGSLISEGPWIFFGFPNAIKAWNLETGMDLRLDGPDLYGQVYAMAVAKDTLFAGEEDGSILVWRGSTENTIPFLFSTSLNAHSGAVICLIVGNKEERLYSGSTDGTIRAWDVDTLQCLHILIEHTDAVTSLICWDNYLLSCSLDWTIKVWGCTKAGNLEEIYSHHLKHGAVTLCGISDAEDKPILCCSCNDNTIYLYDLPSFKERGRIFSQQEVRVIHAGPFGLFFTGDAAGLIKVWKLTQHE